MHTLCEVKDVFILLKSALELMICEKGRCLTSDRMHVHVMNKLICQDQQCCSVAGRGDR